MNASQPPSGVRTRLFGDVDVEGEHVDPAVRLRPLSRRLLARLALSAPGERLDTEELAKQLVIKVAPGVAVAPDKLSSAQQQLRNAQWELRKRLGDGPEAAKLLGSGRRWVALEGVDTDLREFMDAMDGGDRERARAIAARGEFLAGIDDGWTAPHRRTVQERLQTLGPPAHGDGSEAPTRPAPPPSPARHWFRSPALRLAALAVVLAAGAAVGVAELTGGRTPLPDAGKAPPDITPDGKAVELPKKPAGRCQKILPGVSPPRVTPLMATSQVLVGEVRTYHHPRLRRVCAKLVKPYGSPLHGKLSHLAFTLCGEGNRCARDWHSYRIDAGPLVVSSRDGCVSWRVSMAGRKHRWPVRDKVGRTGCS